jgi:glucosamine--fructose-6-phosphate aminotransferase (isomerizing)
MEAGPEIGVASTKAFTSMVTSSFFLTRAWETVIANKTAKKSASFEWKESIKKLPVFIEKSLGQSNHIQKLADKYFDSTSFLFIARGEHFPIALEGALKLKEISYIHAEGYAAGELKHGPIALIDHNMPVIAIAPKDFYYEKTLSNIEQVKARHGRVIGIGEEGDKNLKALCDDIIEVPSLGINTLQTILSVIPLQLFSYFVALRRGTDVDQPRNLAKSVTVE